MSFVLTQAATTIEAECADKQFTRDNVALSYALGLRADAAGYPVDWPRANRAIVERWGVSALEYIKRKAWRLVEDQP